MWHYGCLTYIHLPQPVGNVIVKGYLTAHSTFIQTEAAATNHF